MPRLVALATTLLCATSEAAYATVATGRPTTPALAKSSAVKLRHALEESRALTHRLGVCFSNSLASDDIPSAVVVPLLIVQRAVVILVQALFGVLSAFDIAKNTVPKLQHVIHRQTQHTPIKVPRAGLMPHQKANLDLWFTQYKRTRAISTRSPATTTTIEPPEAAVPPPAPIAVPTQPPNQKPIQLAGDAAKVKRPPATPLSYQSPQAEVLAVNAKTAVTVTPQLDATAPASLDTYTPTKSIWQEQGLPAAVAAKRKAEAVESFFAQLQRHRLGGRR